EATPAGANVHVAGNFNLWNPADPAYRLVRSADGEYAITLPESVRGPIEFKFSLGRWEQVETDNAGGGIENRRFVIPASGAATWTGSVAAWQDPAKIPVRKSTRRPTVAVLDTAFAIPQLVRTRRVWVYLPPDYATSDKRYPVLYMHDGQNVFDDSTSYAGEWGADEALDSLHAAGDPGVIVVAVDNGQQLRMNEYSPWRHPRAGGGEGDAYVDFLARTLKPWIDRAYRTRPGRESTGVMGSSMGGLISLHAALRHPDVFGRVGVFSPSLWFSDSVFVAARNARPAARPRMYFVSGGMEGPPERRGVVVDDQQRMVDTLAAAGWRVGTDLHAAAPDDGQHSEWFWRREFPAAYRWLFAGSHADRAMRRGAAPERE
ncbi:MAG TPA: alpha/beta hydrolase-fold protein, partial [Longimicrobium sp.]|nr:alpha/beta hydrolase-fold protein [Longimicrobium sp.]